MELSLIGFIKLSLIMFSATFDLNALNTFESYETNYHDNYFENPNGGGYCVYDKNAAEAEWDNNQCSYPSTQHILDSSSGYVFHDIVQDAGSVDLAKRRA